MKILDLFNEYNLSPEMTWWEVADAWTEDDRNTMSRMDKAYILTKDFWWIKWLVDNDKITSDWIKPRDKLVKEITIIDEDGNAIWWDNKYTEEEQLLMYLSIQDEPIEFLCSILK